MSSQTPSLDQLQACIHEFWAGPANSLQAEPFERAWEEPLIGFAAGNDPLFQHYKEVVHPQHWTPVQALQASHPHLTDLRPEEVTVICWVLPQTAAARADNRLQRIFPAERWARSRIMGEQFNEKLRQHVVDWLAEWGVPAVAPLLLPAYEVLDDGPYGYAALWSERHAAHAAGLGTFGLCDGLITPVGKAMRVGTVVARLQLPATPRPYDNHRAYCGHFGGDCDECVGRCPVGALSAEGHDKLACRAHLRVTAEYVRAEYGFEGYGCGLCQVGVPCETGIPPRD